MKILVTGGAGFIGSHIVEHFQGAAEVRVLDNLRSGFPHNLAGLKHEFIQASILDREAVRRAMVEVDYVFHLAAMISVPESMHNPVDCNEINTTGTLIVLEEAARAVGLADRGAIAVGQRADLIAVRHLGGLPQVEQVWVRGHAAFSAYSPWVGATA